jgi:hypothetical protein
LALLTGSFDDTDLRVMLTSIGFAVASATASSGAAARLHPSDRIHLRDWIPVAAVIEIADKLEVLNSHPGNREPEIRTQLKRLRDLAESYES